MKSDNRPKAHHKVPRFYLEGFRTDDSGDGKKARIWVYRRGESEPRRCNPSRTGFETDFYTLIAADGQRDTTMEMILRKYVDTPTSAIWHKLTNASQTLTSEERSQIAIFVAFLFTRTSSIRRVVGSTFEQLEEMATKLMNVAEQRAGDPTWQPIPATPGAPGFVINSREELQELRMTHNDFVMMTGAGVEDIAAIISHMNWTLFHGPADALFITSDNPVARDNAVVEKDWLRADITRDGAEISVPVSKNCSLVCSYNGPETHVRVGADTVELLNQRTLSWSESETYSSRRETWLDQAFFGQPTD